MLRCLDLYCKAGGASAGYAAAGFEVTGVDISPQPRYPFAFVLGDALEYVAAHGQDFDLIHASPPCQAHSSMQRMVKADHTSLVAQTRERLAATGRPFVIENVPGAPLRNALILCGTMFGLLVRRHRLFEVSPLPLILTPPCSCRLGVVSGRLIGHRTHGSVRPGRIKPPAATEAELRAAMAVEWMTTHEARQAIPPAYTRFLGEQLLLAGVVPEEPAWIACETCEDFWCNVHEQHAYDCDCPSIEEWETDPYTTEAQRLGA